MKMKKLLISIILAFSFFDINTVYWVDPNDIHPTADESLDTTSASEAVRWWRTWEIPYCSWEYCSFSEWLEDAWREINWIQDADGTDVSSYIQRVVWYLITFTYVIAVILIIYAWVLILISAWEDENVNKWKDIIKYTIIWVITIFLANSIVKFIMNILWQ